MARPKLALCNSALSITKDESTLFELKDAIDQLSIIYEETANFEMESRSVIPPDDFSNLHKMQFWWSNPIIDGIKKFLGTLNEISKIDVRKNKSNSNQTPNFIFYFEEIPNIDEFNKELESLNINL